MLDHLKVIKLYLENCGIRTIERLTGIHNKLISIWIEQMSDKIKLELEKSKNNIKSLKDIGMVLILEL